MGTMVINAEEGRKNAAIARRDAAIAKARAVYGVLMADLENSSGVLRKEVEKNARLTLKLLTKCLIKLGQAAPDGSKLTPTAVMRILAWVGREWRGIAFDLMVKRDLAKIDEMRARAVGDSDAMKARREQYDRERQEVSSRYDEALLENYYHLTQITKADVFLPPFLDTRDVTFKEFLDRRYKAVKRRFWLGSNRSELDIEECVVIKPKKVRASKKGAPDTDCKQCGYRWDNPMEAFYCCVAQQNENGAIAG